MILRIKAYESQIPVDLGNSMLSQILKKEVKNLAEYHKLNVEPIFKLAFKYRRELLHTPFFETINGINTFLEEKGAMHYLRGDYKEEIQKKHSRHSSYYRID